MRQRQQRQPANPAAASGSGDSSGCSGGSSGDASFKCSTAGKHKARGPKLSVVMVLALTVLVPLRRRTRPGRKRPATASRPIAPGSARRAGGFRP